jgi:CDP-diacylglycerol pyrophosphatase
MLKSLRAIAITLSIGVSVLLADGARAASPLPPPPVHKKGQMLWHIVHGICLPSQRSAGDPTPCAEVDISDGVERGHVLLKDISGRSQYLLMPTILIRGIEDGRLLAPDAADYFTPAWQARHLVEKQLGADLAREDVSIAVNSAYGRSQDLLHLHVDCLREDVRDRLRAELDTIGYQWTAAPITLAGHGYRAVRIDGDDALAVNPFQLVAKGLDVADGEMGAWTIVLAGETFPDGKPGFVLLAARADPARGYNGSGEALQDHACRGRGAGEPQ